MTRDALLAEIRESIRKEESAVSIYLKHLSAVVSRSGLKGGKVEKVREVMEFLSQENRKHKAILEALEKKIEGEKADAY